MLSGPLKSSRKYEPLGTLSTQTTTGPVEKSKFLVLGGAWSQAWNMKRLTEGHRQEWSLRLNSIQNEKTHQVQTWHLVVCFFSRNVHPYSFFVWSSITLSSGGLSSRTGSPSGTRTHTKGLLMHSCSRPSGTPFEESAAWNDQGWVWPSQLWLVRTHRR